MDKDETWVPIPRYPGYEVSSYGRVRSSDRTVTTRYGIVRTYKGRILEPSKTGHPPNFYLSVSLGRNVSKQVHVLVCEHFHGPKPSPKHQAAHWDGNHENNLSSNLRWATAKENMEDQIRHGRTARGSKNGFSKLSEIDVKEIHDFLIGGLSLSEIARMKNVSVSTIWNIKEGSSWSWMEAPRFPPVKVGRPFGIKESRPRRRR